MKHQIIFLAILLSLNFSGFCQSNKLSADPNKKITLLPNNTYEIKEFTKDSILIYSGILSSIDPEIKHGKFQFYDKTGNIIVTGSYKQDIPYGIWVYLNESKDTVSKVNYTATLEYLKKDALDYTIDFTVLNTLKKKDKQGMNPDGTFFSCDVMPSFKGKDPNIDFKKYVDSNLLYPIYASRKNILGSTQVHFIIDTNGKIKNPTVINPTNADLSIEAIRVLSESPAWEPGIQNGIPVNVKYSWTFDFSPWAIYTQIYEPIENMENQDLEIVKMDEEEYFYIVEDMPTFNGGAPEIEFPKFIAQNLIYPEIAAENGITGRVLVQFAIDSQGKVVDATIVNDVDPALAKEALRVVTSSPKWKPGFQRGKPVKVVYTFPINFMIESYQTIHKM